MARPERNSVDYFPFYCKEGKAMFYIENKYGNDGYAVWLKLLRLLAVTDYHYLNLQSKPDLMFASSKCRVSEEILISIIDDLCDLGEFNKMLWDENRIIWSDKFMGSIQDAYSKRNNNPLSFEGLLTLLEGLGVRKHPKGKSKDPVKPQSKVEYIKLEENKDEKPQLSVEETFNLFWDRYHEVTGVKKTDKEPALKYWKKLTVEERKKAYVKAKPYSTTNETKYLKKARTYLSDKNFNDDFDTVAENKEDARLYVKNHLTYGQLIGKEPIRSDKYPEYNGLFYHQLKDEFLKPKS